MEFHVGEAVSFRGHLAIVSYKKQIIEIRQTASFLDWLDGLADGRAAERIAQRLVRLQAGLFGDIRSAGGGIRMERYRRHAGKRSGAGTL